VETLAARALNLPFSKRESIIFIGRGGAARPGGGDIAEKPLAGGAARPVAGAADEDASVGPITQGARSVAGAAGRDASAAGPVAKAASACNATKDSQSGQTLPPQGWIVGATRSRMVA
jgi:hypothetical protein